MKHIKPNISLLVVILLIFFAANPCVGLDITRSDHFYQVKSWAMADGLPSNSVYSIVQGQDGYLWMAAETGVARFDGMVFDVFNHQNTPALPAAIIQQLLMDRNGTLWIASRGGGVIRCKDHRFKAYTKLQGLGSDETWTLMESGDGTIWVGSDSGLNLISGDTILPVSFLKPSKLSEIRALLEDHDGNVWAGTRVHGLFQIRKQGGMYEAIPYPGLEKVSVCFLLEDRQRTLWIATADSGLIRLKGGNMSRYDTRSGLSDNWVNVLFQDSADNLWIGTNVGGLFVIPAGSDKLNPFPNPNRFSGNAFRAFFEDHEKTLWMGREGAGLGYIRNTKIAAYSKKNGLASDNTFGIYQDHQGTMWSGSRGNGVNIIKNGKITHLNTGNGLPANSSTTFASRPDGTVWIGTLGGGALRIKNGKFRVFDQRDGLTDRYVRCLYIEPDGTLWAGTENGDLHYFKNGRFILYWNFQSRVNCILRDRAQNLWVCTSGGGAFMMGPGAAKPVAFDTSTALPGNKLCGILEDFEGAVWVVGYGSGLSRYKNNRWISLTTEEGLPDNGVYWILEDRNHDLWISSNSGIFQLRRHDLEDFLAGKTAKISPTVFGVDDGMIDLECNGGNQPAGWRDRDGKLWFPSTKALLVIDPKNLGINKQMPPVTIKSVQVDGKELPLREWQKKEPGLETELSTGGKIRFQFTALSFIVSRKILFKYRLEGGNTEWSIPSQARTAIFRNLPPGDYRFRVAACNSDGVWNQTGAYFDFRVTAPFFQTTLFKLILGALFLLLTIVGWGFLKKYRAAVRYKNRYKNSPLPEPASDEWIKILDTLMRKDKIYRSPEISLKSLADRMNISQRMLSQFLNDGMNTSFYELINRYRVEEAQRLLTQPEARKKTVLDIGFDVGFNSKTAFNRAFKQFTAMTPSQYRKKHRVDIR